MLKILLITLLIISCSQEQPTSHNQKVIIDNKTEHFLECKTAALKFRCRTCGYEGVRELYISGHSHGFSSVTTSGSGKVTAIRLWVCTNCGAVKTDLNGKVRNFR